MLTPAGTLIGGLPYRIPDLPYSVAIEPFALAVLRAFLQALQVGLSKSLQEGLPGPLPRGFRAVRVPDVQSPKNSTSFQEFPGLQRDLPKPSTTFARPDWLARLSSQTTSNSTIGLISLESTSRDGYDRLAGRPAFGFARPPLKFARGDSSTLTASAPPSMEDRQKAERQPQPRVEFLDPSSNESG